MNIKVLRQQKADTLKKATDIDALATKENRAMTAAERKDFDAAMDSVKTINGDIERAEALMNEERRGPVIEVSAPEASKEKWTSLTEQLRAVRLHATSKGTNTDPRLYAPQ